MIIKLSFFLISFIFSSILFSQQDSSPCSSDEASQFDFWVGKWDAEWIDKNGNKLYGQNYVEKILNGCVIKENFDGNPGVKFIGKSFSVYDVKSNLWKQTWVDNAGGYLDFSGMYKNNKMILSRSFKNRDEKIIFQRMVWFNINSNNFDWNWEKSTDQGKAWETVWQIHYTRIIDQE